VGRGEVKTMSLKTNYIGHDAQYKRFKAEGMNGWNDEQDWKAWEEALEDLCKDLVFPKSGKLLELGCGAGEVSLFFAEKGYQVYGIDIAPTAIEWAMEKALKTGMKAEFIEGDVRNLRRWEDEIFDVVIDGHCLHCIIGDDRAKMLKESYRVLKSGGLFYISTMCGEVKDPESKPYFNLENRCIMSRDGQIATRYVGLPEDIIREVVSAGFKIVKSKVENSKDYFSQDITVYATKQ
jgi:ubiquinone/menaquinone biosynthesis C-methylase UbiE